MGLVAKDEVNAQGNGDSVYPEHLVDVGFEFFLLVVLLEGVAAGDDAVAVGDDASGAIVDQYLGGDDEDFLGQTPGVDQGFSSLGGVFDDVDHVAQIDHVGWGVGNIGSKVRIPTGASEP